MAILVVGLGVQGFITLRRRQAWQEVLNAAAKRFGLAVRPASLGVDAEAEGVVGGVLLEVWVETVRPVDDGRRREGLQTRGVRQAVVVARPPGLPLDLILAPEGRRGGLAGLLRDQDRVIGDTPFDASVVVGGDEAWLRAVLDAPTRSRVQQAVALGFEVADGAIRRSSERALGSSLTLGGLIEQAVELARLLRTDDVRAGLWRVIHSEVDLEVVAGAVARFLDRQPTAEEVEHLLAHPQAHVRLAVARRFGGPAGEHALAELVTSSAPADVRAEALAAWSALDVGRAAAVAGTLLTGTPAVVLVAALTTLAEAGRCPPLDQVPGLAVMGAPARLALARCLVHSNGDPEPHLLEILEDSDESVACAATTALAARGTSAAVQPLRARARRGGSLLREAVDRAIGEIQGAVAHLGGGLSIARDRGAGGLALPEGHET